VIRTAVFEATHRREYEQELLLAKRHAEAAEMRSTALARTLQSTLIPPSPPAIPGLELAADYRPAGDGTEVGGDFYDVFQLAPDDWVVVIGDVCGKGVDAAVVTSLVRYSLRAAVVEHPRPAEALRLLNTAMLSEGIDRFCTVALLRLRRTDGHWTCEIASGGHPLPRLRAADGTTRTVGRPGSLIGVMDDPDLYDAAVPLNAGDVLLLHTDGVPDGRRGRTFFGEEGIDRILGAGHESAQLLVEALLSAVLAFQGGVARDDIAIVVIKVA
jgi:sigma-B regulation protein RsbU (phosphoserine phosphatase)